MENISREVDYLSTESILSIRLLLLIEKLKSARDYGTSDCTEATEPDDEEEEEDDVEDQDSFIEVAEIVQTLLSSSFERYAASTISQESFSLETKGTVDEITTPTSTFSSRPYADNRNSPLPFSRAPPTPSPFRGPSDPLAPLTAIEINAYEEQLRAQAAIIEATRNKVATLERRVQEVKLAAARR